MIVFARYIMLKLARRSEKDPRRFGSLFQAGCNEQRQVGFAEVVTLPRLSFPPLINGFADEIVAPIAALQEVFMAPIPALF